MGDGDEFLRAILAAPEEDAPRLAYADWLAQRGNPFGEFIRVQCRLAHTDSEDSLYPSLRDKEQYLFAHHAAGWLDEAVARLLFGEQYDPNDVWALPDFEQDEPATPWLFACTRMFIYRGVGPTAFGEITIVSAKNSSKSVW
jgi:uncharacterized protein (TIGR02996 family)